MIRYRAELLCTGCSENLFSIEVFYEPSYCHEATESLERKAKEQGWIRDKGDAHFCPACQVQRKAG